ncbi:S26 family signal peptidase [Micromonospora sp. NBC_01699]|uniref:S26 family signal peptidase n=1 Tax=Micromonospora sp. NBC_01699 TaxID=2975984 RepID=UPI002E291047|nr:S26 family signal peptidase [Micromonospora sp. NBC_01699]
MILALLGVAVLASGLGWLRLGWLVVTVTGQSMRPTMQPGDRILVRRTSTGRIRAGQIVVLDANPGWIIKRVAAAPGDRVLPGLAPDAEDRVPPGRLLLLGDNRSRSSDSRQHGYYDGTHLVGVAVRSLTRRKT